MSVLPNANPQLFNRNIQQTAQSSLVLCPKNTVKEDITQKKNKKKEKKLESKRAKQLCFTYYASGDLQG